MKCKLPTTWILVALLTITSCRIHKSTTRNVNPAFTEIRISASLQKEIEHWLGKPYKYGGNTEQGIDCSGLVCAIYKKVYHITLPRTAKGMYDKYESIPTRKLKEGDLVFFDFEGNGVSHVGIYLDQGKFVQASKSKGVVISNLLDKYIQTHFLRGGRVGR